MQNKIITEVSTAGFFFSAKIFRENRKSCFSVQPDFFVYRPNFSVVLNPAQTILARSNTRQPPATSRP